MRLPKLIVLLGLAGSVGACAPHPIVARDPIPAPSPDEAFVCDSRPSPIVAKMFDTNCEERLRERRTVLQSKG
ncbi:hypothetical protein MMB17_22800 [Methylobacterium organophilum]|uniref:hypothetical protein n=1 Tax=Methylobacterium organophilum TaxID=410 RepID=UPI001F12D829|nr:hypothetical protein [Methylobacterium organophilum]UMY17415.1 hypothetical protein MMB17_22800 [Methylobacterium organophilum]